MANIVTIESKPAEGAVAAQPVAQPGASAPQSPHQGLQVTERAVKRIRAAMAKEGVSPEEGGLRVGVMGGGCSGLSYSIKFDTRPRERDRIYEFDGVRVFVDPKSFLYLHGMTLDYEETLMRQGFNFINPNSKRSCGCGSSFSS
jgi:iron-sulfur cluster assembly protein